MKKSIQILFLFLLALGQGTKLQGQNLVLNPSFEDTLSTNYDMFFPICKNWYNPNNATADYFSPFCQELLWGNGYCVPYTTEGFQQPQDGVAFIGLDIYEKSAYTGKEYAQGFLSQPLVQGKKYYVSMYINLVNNSMYKICEIEIAFIETLIYSNQGTPFNFTDTVKFNISNADTTGWLFVTGKYTAHGGEKYIYIGSNTPNANINCVDSLTGLSSAAYYYIDNIYVSENPLLISEMNTLVTIIFPNPVSNVFNVNNLSKYCNYSIIDITGFIIKKGSLYKNNNEINVSSIPNGIYFFKLNERVLNKLIINH